MPERLTRLFGHAPRRFAINQWLPAWHQTTGVIEASKMNSRFLDSSCCNFPVEARRNRSLVIVGPNSQASGLRTKDYFRAQI